MIELTAQALAAEFSKLIGAALTADELALTIARNKTTDYVRCCATHDFVDANLVMLEAYANLASIEEDDIDLQDDTVISLMNRAWDMSRENEFKVAA